MLFGWYNVRDEQHIVSGDRPFLPEDTRTDRSLVRVAVARRLLSFAAMTRRDFLRRTWPHDRGALCISSRAHRSARRRRATGASRPRVRLQRNSLPASRRCQRCREAHDCRRCASRLDGPPFSFPYLQTPPAPQFIGEDDPIPLSLPVRGHAELVAAQDRRDHRDYGGFAAPLLRKNAETLLGTLLREAAAKALDMADVRRRGGLPSRPAGLLNGVSPIAAAVGYGRDAAAEDIGNLVDAISAAGGGAQVMLFAHRAVRFGCGLLAGVGLALPVVAVARPRPRHAVLAVDTGAFVSGFSV